MPTYRFCGHFPVANRSVFYSNKEVGWTDEILKEKIRRQEKSKIESLCSFVS